VSIEALLASLVISSVLASVFFAVTRVLDAMNGSGISGHASLVLAVKAITPSGAPPSHQRIPL